MLCRRGTRDSLCQASLCTAYYQGHSAAACAAPTQSPVAALNGYDGTALFHHAAYAASYTARLSYVAGDATSYIWHRPDKTAPGHDERRAPGAGKESRREISIACNA